VSSLDERYFSWNDTDLTWSEWLVAGNDNGGRAERTGR
jgi:hypothetical protein